jgi:Tfp pilus assembly protein PilF
MKKIAIKIFLISTLLLNVNLATFADNYSDAQQYIKRAKTASIEEQSYDYLNKARTLLEKDYETDKTNIKLLMSLSEVFQLIGDRREAKLFILQAYNIAPNDMYVQKGMGDFYYNFQEYTTALEYYKLSLYYLFLLLLTLLILLSIPCS